MSNNTFLALVRQYAALSQRYQRSFAPAVEAVTQSRVSTIMSSDLPDDVKEQTVERIEATAQREYHDSDVWAMLEAKS